MLAPLSITLALALCAAAAPPLVVRKSPITVPIARRFSAAGTKTILEQDQIRANSLKRGSARKAEHKTDAKGASGSDDVPVTNGAVTYTA